MLTTIGRSLVMVLLVVTVNSGVAAGQPLHSADLARKLSAALSAQKMDAIAAKDPDEPDRFVAALFFADVQLLVVSARYAAPVLLDAKLEQRQYRDVYSDLQGSALPNSSIFFQDAKGNGLCGTGDQDADVLYDGSPTPKIFDGDWDKHKLSQKAYEQQCASADQQYSRLLQILLARVSGAT
jgi:hypothetical protein